VEKLLSSSVFFSLLAVLKGFLNSAILLLSALVENQLSESEDFLLSFIFSNFSISIFSKSINLSSLIQKYLVLSFASCTSSNSSETSFLITFNC